MGLFTFGSKKKHNSSKDKYEKINVMGWLRRNSIKYQEDVIKKTFKYFKIPDESYQLVANGYGDYDILIEYNAVQYKVQIDEERMCYNLLCQNRANNLKKKEKYHYINSFEGDDLIYDTLKYITNNKSN